MHLQRRYGALLAVAIAVTATGTPRLAHAEDKPAARAAFSEGTRHYDLGEYAEALQSFKRAYWNYEEPAFLFNIAQCQRQLGKKAEAVKFYRTYLNKIPNAPNRDAVEHIIAELDAAIALENATAQHPPQGTLPPDGPPPVAAPPVAQPSVAASAAGAGDATTVVARPQRRTPIYKKWWLWTAVGAVAVVGLGVGLGVGLSQHSSSPTSFPGVSF